MCGTDLLWLALFAAVRIPKQPFSYLISDVGAAELVVVIDSSWDVMDGTF